MDRARFDCFTRALGNASSRRGAAKALAGGVLGLAGLTAVSDAWAGCSHKGQECAVNRNCCRGLICKDNDGGEKVGKCKYKHGCGKKRDFCKDNADCCGGFKCKNRKCQR